MNKLNVVHNYLKFNKQYYYSDEKNTTVVVLIIEPL